MFWFFILDRGLYEDTGTQAKKGIEQGHLSITQSLHYGQPVLWFLLDCEVFIG